MDISRLFQPLEQITLTCLKLNVTVETVCYLYPAEVAARAWAAPVPGPGVENQEQASRGRSSEDGEWGWGRRKMPSFPFIQRLPPLLHPPC